MVRLVGAALIPLGSMSGLDRLPPSAAPAASGMLGVTSPVAGLPWPANVPPSMASTQLPIDERWSRGLIVGPPAD